MELWIRSQKRDNLIKVDWLKMEEIPDGYGYKEYYIYYKNERLLGSYKTKERALEVLDEIQRAILCTGLSYEELAYRDEEYTGRFSTNSKSCVAIYEMPEE